MDSVPMYVVIGAILGIISSIVLLILHFQDLVETIRSFPNRSYKWLKRSRNMFRERKLWGKYCPSWEIIDSGNVEIFKIGNDYQIKIPIKINFKSRDDRYETTLYVNKTKVIMWHKKDDREGNTYELKGSLAAISIPPSDDYTVNFSFMKELKAQPLIDMHSYVKYIVYPGEAFISGISEIRSLGKSNKLTAQVTQGVQEESEKGKT